MKLSFIHHKGNFNNLTYLTRIMHKMINDIIIFNTICTRNTLNDAKKMKIFS